MDFLSITLFAMGMSLDDFALALSLSLLVEKPNIRERIWFGCKMGIAFSISSGLLPFVGWLVGIGIYKWVVAISAWIVLVLFCGVGAWAIKEAFEKDQNKFGKKNLESFWTLVIIGILGSVDEGAAGIGLAFLETSILIMIISIIISNLIFILIATLISSHVPITYQKITKILAGIFLIVLGIIKCIELLR